MAKATRKDIASVLHASKAGVVLDLEVSPGAKRAGFSSVNPWRKTLCITVKAPPRKGEANKDVVDLMSDIFGISSNDVAIIAGTTSSKKRVELIGVTLERALDVLVKALEGPEEGCGK